MVQVGFCLEGDGGIILTCVGLDGLEVLRLKTEKSNRLSEQWMFVAVRLVN